MKSQEQEIRFTTSLDNAPCKPVSVVYGPEGSGKTLLGMSMPARAEKGEMIGVVPLDPKTRRTVKIGMRKWGKKVIMPEEDLIRVGDPMLLSVESVKASMERYRAHVDKVKLCVKRLLAMPKVTSVILDNGSVLWQDVLFAHFGRTEKILPRDRGGPNAEMAEIVGMLAASGKHVLIPCRQKEIWKDDKSTGRYTWEGYPALGYVTEVTLQMKVDKARKDLDEKYKMYVVQCQENPSLEGTGTPLFCGEEITYPNLLAEIYPDYDGMEEWY